MTKDKGIFIKNIYYMLAYAFGVLKEKNYEDIAAEDFDDAGDLFAAILSKGVANQLKRGLYKEYVTRCEELAVMRGKPDIYGTVKTRLQKKRLISCRYDELSVNNIYNKILKTTINILIRDPGVKKVNKAALKSLVLFFNEVDDIRPCDIRWQSLMYRRNNKHYEMLMNICYFVLDGMLLTTGKGSYKMRAFSDEHMHRLYEKFVLEYYRKNHSWLSEVRPARVRWDLDEEAGEAMMRFLPVMQTDILLRYKDRVLIIDTKYYGRTLQQKYDKQTLHSGNIYQIFTYVKNYDNQNTGKVSGLLLYAKTNEALTPDLSFVMGGNRIGVKTLDLNREFKSIAAGLDGILREHFEGAP